LFSAPVAFAAIGAIAVFMAIGASAVACRQVLGVSTDQPLLDASASNVEGGAGEGGATGSFTVMNGLPQGEQLTAIWGVDSAHFIAVGTSQVIYKYEDGVLSRGGGNSVGRDYAAVWGRNFQDVYAVGYSESGTGFVQHYDGTQWTEVYATPVPLYGVWGVADGHVVAVGDKGLMYGTRPGYPWNQIQVVPPNQDVDAGPRAPILWSVAGRSLDDYVIAADLDYFIHYEPKGGGFAYYEPTVETTTSFRFAWQGPGATTSVFFGTNYYGLYWFTAPGTDTDASVLPPGSGFALVELARDEAAPDAKNAAIEGIWGTAEKVIAVGDAGRVYVFDAATDTVTTLPPPTDEVLGGVWGSSLDDVWIVGGRELILHGSIR
jgi:hypothetical protein